MTDNLIENPRYKPRTQTAFVRSLRLLNLDTEQIPDFNIKYLIRLTDMNPPVFVCALTLLNQGVEQDPAVIREHKVFLSLIDALGLQPSKEGHKARNSYKASLILLEVFIYMLLISRARYRDTEEKAEKKLASESHLYEQEELTQ